MLEDRANAEEQRWANKKDQEAIDNLKGKALKQKDPDRIPRIMDLLDHAWKSTPHLRLCQLIANLTSRDAICNQDIFYIEDAELEKLLNEWGRKAQ